MIVEHTRNSQWLSNTWLVADRPGGHGVLIDTGGPPEPILKAIEDYQLTITHVLCSHHHHDHVEHNALYQAQLGCPICGHRNESELFGDLDTQLGHGDELVSGDLHVRALHIPGHTSGQLAFSINDQCVFTGDTLFRGSVGGTRAPDHTTYDDIRHSIMEVLMVLPKDMMVYPGHMEPTTIAREWQENPFIRMWSGRETVDETRCLAFGLPATLLLSATDYDRGRKCVVRFEQGNQLDIVPGSRVEVIA
jgi:hydroxyacylglutathione hydrolase